MLQFLPDAKLQLLMCGCVENAKIGDSTRIWKFAFFFFQFRAIACTCTL